MTDKPQVNVRAVDEDLKAKYVNHIAMVVTKEEFILDCLSVFGPQGVLVNRIALSPGHAKRLNNLLSEQIKQYEDNYGSISEAEESPRKIGFANKE